MARKIASGEKIAIGDIREVSGEVTIAGGDIYNGLTAEQVSDLITQITSTFEPKKFDGNCPYKGLDVFEVEDANLFFGREKLVDDLVSRVKDSRTVFITGPSGSGKSSLVRAGLMYALKQGKIKNSQHWLYATMKPGREPMEALASALSRIKSPELGKFFRENISDPDILNECAESALSEAKDQRLVLFLDQFEEIFTQLSPDKTQAFINLITNAATSKNGRIIVLFSMRSDFVSNCANYPDLNELLNQQFVQIGAMGEKELVSAIAQPALRVGLQIDPNLIAQIISDMQGEPGALPLMQFALKDLFDSEQAEGGLIALTLEGYLEHGGIHKALERHADDSFAQLGKHEQELARSIFSGLIEIGRGTQDTRRTALFDELIPADTKPDDIEIIVRKLADARLITTDEQAGRDTVSISHEKLIDAWPWLKKLVNENRDVIALQNQIADNAKEWDENNRDASYLYTGGRLINSYEQLSAKQLSLSGIANIFLQAGLMRQQREQRKRIFSIAGVIGLIVGGVLLFSYVSTTNAKTLAEQSKNSSNTQVALANTSQANADIAQTARADAVEQAHVAHVGQLVAESISLREKNFPISLLLSIEAYRKLASVQSEGVLLDNVQANPFLDQYLALHQDEVFCVAFSPDGKTLASGGKDKTIILWDLERKQTLVTLEGHTSSVTSVAFSPDGLILASGSVDKTVILWDMETYQPIMPALTGHDGGIHTVAFSPDGMILASGSADKTILLWDVETHSLIAPALKGHASTVTTVAFSPDGKILASGSTDIILWDIENYQPIDRPPDELSNGITAIAFSPDGKTIAFGDPDNNIVLWDIEDHKTIDKLVGHKEYITGIAFSPDGRILVSGSLDRTIILWNENAESYQPLNEPLIGHANWVRSVAFSPDGQTISSSGSDNMVILWSVKRISTLGQLLTGHEKAVFSIAISPNGQTIASGSEDETIILWDIKTGLPIDPPFSVNNGAVISVAFNPDGNILASGNADKSITLWDVESHQPIGPSLTGHNNEVFSVAFSPDGRILASGSSDTSIILWNMESLQPIKQLVGHTKPVNSVAFNPDGQILASGSEDKTIILWDVQRGQPIGEPLTGHEGIVNSIVFSPDGRVLASGGSSDYNVLLWNTDNHKSITSPLTSQNGFIYSVAFSPDGKLLASGGYNNSIQLWNTENLENPAKLGEPLINNSLTISSLAFSNDGKYLVSGNADNSVILWDIVPKSWIEKICQRVGRNFSRGEWAQYFPNEDYRVTCPQWPNANTISAIAP